MFEKTLTALIKGLRSHRGKDEEKYISTMMDEIRSEIKSADMDVKGEAVLKLTYLHMLGYRLSSASFHILETMASPIYRYKFIGYLAASMCFGEDTEVLILATNLVKKDLHSAQPPEVLAALHGLSHIMTQELAQHLADDVILMLTHSRAMVRKSAVLVLYTIIMRCPEVLDRTYERLRDLLCDEDQSVITATVNVICELARRNPAPFVPLSPQLFEILTISSNNWLLIKVVKLFGALAPVEPRLVRKLHKPIMSIISTTPAMSLLFECIHTAIIGGLLERSDSDELAYRCVENLGVFLQNEDQNLRYIALLALDKLALTHPHLVAQHQQEILQSIQHPDLTIRIRALELVSRLGTDPLSLRPIVDYLVAYLSSPENTLAAPNAAQSLLNTLESDRAKTLETTGPAVLDMSSSKLLEFRRQVAESILDLGGSDNFNRVRDFSWYLNTLTRLATLVDSRVIPQVVDQLTDLVFLHADIHEEACALLMPMILDVSMYDAENPMSELLRASAAICSEYVEYIDSIPSAIESLLQDSLQHMPSRIISACIQSAMKMYAYWAACLAQTWKAESKRELVSVTMHMQAQLAKLGKKEDAEVYERSKEGLQLFNLLLNGLEAAQPPSDTEQPAEGSGEWGEALESKAPRALHLLLPLFYVRSDRLEAPESLPASMDLHAWIIPESSWLDMLSAATPAPKPAKPTRTKLERPTVTLREKPASDTRLPKAYTRHEEQNSPFYLTSKPNTKLSKKKKAVNRAPPSEMEDDLNDVPIVNLDLSDLTPKQRTADDTPSSSGPSVQPKVVAHKKSARRK